MARALRPKPGFRVEVVPIEDAAKLLTIDAMHGVWGGDGPASLAPGISFVRMQPPKSCPEWRVAQLKKGFEGLGATVRVERQNEDDRTPEAMHESVVSPEVPISGAREVVLAMVGESKSGAGEDLVAFVEDVMREAGL